MPTPILYPDAITQIPYASFLEITRLEYKKGLEAASGATEELLTSKLAGFFAGVGNAAAFLYNSTGTQQTALNQAVTQIQNQKRALVIGTGANARSIREIIQSGQIDELPDSALEGVKLSDGTQVTKAYLKQLYSASTIAKNKGVQKLKIALPNEMQFGYGANWNNTFKIGTLAQAFANAGGLLKTGAAAGIGGFAGWKLASVQAAASKDPRAALIQGAAQGAAKALNPANINSSLNPLDPAGFTNVLGLAGLAPNENAVQFFKNVDFREFTFTFEVFEDKPGSKKANEIVEFFKYGMHPGGGAGTGILKFPDVFILRPRFVPVGADGTVKKDEKHYLLPNSKSCALTNLQVNVTPMNTIQTTYDGVFPLVTISVTFKEITALVKEDFEMPDKQAIGPFPGGKTPTVFTGY